MAVVLVEGIDRIGKSSACEYLSKELGYSKMHFSKPLGITSAEKAHFQMGTFDRMFQFIRALEGPYESGIAMDRAHLGEYVYGPMYRGDSGVDVNYIFEMEKAYGPFRHAGLILLVHHDLDVVRARDDGLSFDPGRMAEEQNRFKEAFSKSSMIKTTIDVTGMSIPDVHHVVNEFVSNNLI